MNKEQKEWFEKGRVYEQKLAEQKAEEKYESIIICLLERAMGGEGVMSIADLDITLAKSRYVTFISRNIENLSTEITLKKEIK